MTLQMEEYQVAWIEFGVILAVVGAFVCCMFHLILSIRWLHREKTMNKFLREIKRPPIVHLHELKTDLDCKVGEFRRVAFT